MDRWNKNFYYNNYSSSCNILSGNYGHNMQRYNLEQNSSKTNSQNCFYPNYPQNDGAAFQNLQNNYLYQMAQNPNFLNYQNQIIQENILNVLKGQIMNFNCKNYNNTGSTFNNNCFNPQFATETANLNSRINFNFYDNLNSFQDSRKLSHLKNNLFQNFQNSQKIFNNENNKFKKQNEIYFKINSPDREYEEILKKYVVKVEAQNIINISQKNKIKIKNEDTDAIKNYKLLFEKSDSNTNDLCHTTSNVASLILTHQNSDSSSPLASNKKAKNLNKIKKTYNITNKVTDCPHTDKKHYAKNMCNNCYHSKGRKKRAWNCSHSDKFHYAFGICQNCYQLKYFKNRNIYKNKKRKEGEEVKICHQENMLINIYNNASNVSGNTADENNNNDI